MEFFSVSKRWTLNHSSLSHIPCADRLVFKHLPSSVNLRKFLEGFLVVWGREEGQRSLS